MNHVAGPRRLPRPLPVAVFVLLIGAIALSNVFVVSRTADSIQTSVDISADRTLNAVLPNGKLISGTVEDVSGASLVGATVMAVSADGFATQPVVTGLNGSFDLAVRPGTYEVLVRPPLASSEDISDFPRQVPVSAGSFRVKSDTSVGTVTLPDGYVVSGQVSTAAGGATNLIGWMLAVPSDGASPWLATPAVFGTGADSKTYYLALPRGKFNLIYGGAQGYTSKWDMTPMASYGVGKATVTADKTVNIKVPGGSKLSGTVKDKAGTSLNGTLGIVKKGSSPFVDGGSTFMPVMNGKFIGYLPNGDYDAVFMPDYDNTYKGRGTKTEVSVKVGAGSNTLAITAEDGVVLSGKITNAKGKVVATSSIAAIPLGVDPVSLAAVPIGIKADSKTGAYRLPVPAGTYDIQASPVGFPELAAVQRLALAAVR